MTNVRGACGRCNSHVGPILHTWARRHARGQRRPDAYLAVNVRIKWLTRIFRDSRATNTPCKTPNPPKRRPIQPIRPSVSCFQPMGLHFGGHTTANHGRAAANRGELRHARVRHAGDTPPEGFAWRKTPIVASLKCAASPTRLRRSRLVRKTRPASTIMPNLGCIERAGRTFSRPKT